jgi:hypothetical protein
MKLNTQKTNVISFTRKTNSIHFDYQFSNAVITRTDCVKDLGVCLDNQLYFHHHQLYIFCSLNSSWTHSLYNVQFFFSGQPIGVVRLACSV